jgi:hypothetical protein
MINAKRHKIKQNGVRTLDWCIYCMCLKCDPSGCFPNSIAYQKMRKRERNGQCIACGKLKAECSCRSKENKKW